MGNYIVQNGDSLYKIVSNEYGLTDKTVIANKVNEIVKNNNIKNPNLIFANQKIQLPESITLNDVSIMSPTNETVIPLEYEKGNKNYYRADDAFGDIATKQQQYPNQEPKKSKLKLATQTTTGVVENVVIDISADLTLTSRDAQAYDIAAKPAGVSGFNDMNGSDAYKLFLEVNADDFTKRDVLYNGKIECKDYFDASKSDGKITVFSSELINGKEYLAMRDKEGIVHYFDFENKLNEVYF